MKSSASSARPAVKSSKLNLAFMASNGTGKTASVICCDSTSRILPRSPRWPASSSACHAHSRKIRCCGSSASASRGVKPSLNGQPAPQWRLAVKAGRDGKDGKESKSAPSPGGVQQLNGKSAEVATITAKVATAAIRSPLDCG